MTDEITNTEGFSVPEDVPVKLTPEPRFVFNCDPYVVTVGQLGLALNMLGVVIEKSTYVSLPPTLKALFRSVG